jgi:hypothetical protein
MSNSLLRRVILLLSAGFILLIPFPIYGVVGEGGYPGAYLRLGAGARALGMGGAFVALADDVTASYWNPAGLGQLESSQLAAMYSLMSMDRMHNFITYAQPLGKLGTLGASLLNFGVRNIDGRDTGGIPTEFFSSSENAFLVSIGRKLAPALFIGGNLKFLYHNLASTKATGVGFDIGAILKIREALRIGATIQDIGSDIKWDTESRLKEEFLTVTRVGISIIPKTTPLKIFADLERNQKQETKYHVGAEYWVLKSIAARIGYDRHHFTIGASAVIPISSTELQLDYAFCPDVLQQWPTNRMSMSIKF